MGKKLKLVFAATMFLLALLANGDCPDPRCLTARKGTVGRNAIACSPSTAVDYFGEPIYTDIYYCASDKECSWGVLCRTPPRHYCYCATPGAGTIGHNKYKCTDGTHHYCATHEYCFYEGEVIKKHARQGKMCRPYIRGAYDDTNVPREIYWEKDCGGFTSCNSCLSNTSGYSTRECVWQEYDKRTGEGLCYHKISTSLVNHNPRYMRQYSTDGCTARCHLLTDCATCLETTGCRFQFTGDGEMNGRCWHTTNSEYRHMSDDENNSDWADTPEECSAYF